MGLVVSMPIDADESFGKVVAKQTAGMVIPEVHELIRQEVQTLMPSESMTQKELCARLGYKTNTANPEFLRMAYEVLPHYGKGQSTRWDRQAVNDCLKTYYE